MQETVSPETTRAGAADVVILAAGRDGSLTRDILARARFSCRLLGSEAQMLDALTPQVGSLLIAEELLSPTLMTRLAAALQAQPAWSDLPVVLVANSTVQRLPLSALGELGNVALIQRPMSQESLVSTIASALRARRRQWQVRDLLQEQQDQADRKDQFMAMLAHELRNPLAPIRYAAHLLQRPGIAEAKLTDMARLVERQVGHMGHIIDQLLDVSRLTRGLIRLDKTRLDLCALARDTLAAHAIAAQAKSIVVECSCNNGVWLDGDETRLRQVLDNLIDNAIKFSPPGTTVKVTIAANDHSLRLSVIDQGEGIEKHLQPLLFDAFVQADRSLERSRGGLGLGLALVKGMVEMHGGRVSVTSEGPGTGSAFTVELPVAQTVARDRPFHATTVAQGPVQDVLIVEDNVDTADSLRMILEAHGYRVHVVHSGPAALEALGSLRPDVLICDIGLPGMSGYDVARAANSSRHRPELMVAVTGYASPEDHSAATAAGFDAHMAKPIAVPELLAKLSAAAA